MKTFFQCERRGPKGKKKKERKENTSTTTSNGYTKRCIDNWSLAGFLIADESLMHFHLVEHQSEITFTYFPNLGPGTSFHFTKVKLFAGFITLS